MPKRKNKRAEIRRIAKANPQVDPQVLGESIELIDYLRKIGIKSAGFNILRSSESRLKIKRDAVHKL
jgi:hypothetical protein